MITACTFAVALTVAQAQVPDSAAAPPVKEIQLTAGAFAREPELPSWSLPLAEVPATTRRNPVVLRLAETQMSVTTVPAYLIHRAVQVNDTSSLAAIGQFTIQFVPQYQKLRLHRVQLERNSVLLDRMQQVQLRFLERETGLEGGLYSGAVTAVLLLDDVRVGDTLRIVYSVSGQNPVFGDTFSDSGSWDQIEPTELRRLTMLSPVDRRLEWRMHGDFRSDRVRPRETVRDGTRVLLFEERGIDGLDLETHIPSDYVSARFIQFTGYADWNHVARWATGLFPAKPAIPAELQPVLDRLRAIPEASLRAAAALQWVQDEVRYFSVSLGESSHRPYAPEQVVQRRYGDCKDKTYLLVTMLRALDIEATPVLVSLRAPAIPAKLLPTPDVFDHVIAQVRIDGKVYYLDATRLGQRGPLARMGLTLEGARGLLVREDSAELITVASPDALELATTEVREVFTLGSFDGDARLESRRVWNGATAEFLRVVYGRLSPEQRRAQAGVDYERRYPGITLDGEPRVIDEPEMNRFVTETTFRVPKPAREFEGSWALRFFPTNLQGAISLPQKINRQFPAQVALLPYQAQYQLVVNWPENVSMILDPSTQRVDSDFFGLQVQRSFRGNVATVSVNYTARADALPAKDLPRLMQDLQRLDRTLGGAVVVDRAAIKNTGLFGLGKTSVQQSMQARLAAELRRLNATLEERRLQGDDLAEALCRRAETLADSGMAAEGLNDAREAVRIAPALARAWECRGNVQFAIGEFERAIPDYTRSLGLGGDSFASYYRRGHARFYAAQYDAAAADFARAAEARQGDDESDGLYARLWQVWSLQRAGRPLGTELQALAGRDVRGAWPRPALAMLVGALSPEQVIADVQNKKGDERELTLAEAWFYVGQHHRAKGDMGQARAAFEKARGQGITMYIEHVAAGFELAQMK